MPELPETASSAISFQVLAEIAVGATARVDLCRAADGRLLAVKRLHQHLAEDAGFAAQFFDEIWMTARIKHPNVVDVAGWGKDERGMYLAVELVEGVSMSRLMKTIFETGEEFTERMVVYIGLKLCEGLAAAHGLRGTDGALLHLVHRDLTPGNVLLGFNGAVKITDFGLAKAMLRLTKTLTGTPKGEPKYMAPEQAKAQDIDARADLFTFGIVLFELFTGRRPWLAKSDQEMVHRTATEPPADLFELRPKIDKELVAIVIKCLEKSPDARFESALEVHERFAEWLDVHGYTDENDQALARFVRRNAMRQMRWFERAIGGTPASSPGSSQRATEPPAGSAKQPARTVPRPAPRSAPPPVADDTTETEPEGKAITQDTVQEGRIKTLRSEPAKAAAVVDEPSTDAEEAPTLIQTEHPLGLPPKKGRRAASRPFGNILEEDSDDRVTDVRRHAKSTSGIVPAIGFGPESGPIDGESDDLTTPVPASVRALLAGMVPNPSTSGVMPAFLPSVSWPIEETPPPLGRGVMDFRADATSDLRTPTARSPEPGYRSRPPGEPRSTTPDTIAAEVDRLAIDAVRRSEEAKVAAARAERKAAQAKLAAQAAQIAAEALDLVPQGLALAAARLEDARKVEALVEKAQVLSPSAAPSPASLLPPSAMGSLPPPPDSVPSSLRSSVFPGTGQGPHPSLRGPDALNPPKPRIASGLLVAAAALAAFAFVLLVLWILFGSGPSRPHPG